MNQLILVVDDEPSIRHLLRHTLKETGYTVLTASDPEEALVIASSQTISLLITDVHMKGMDGFKLTETIRQMPPYTKLPVIIISKHSSVKCGTVEVLDDFTYQFAKPFSLSEMRTHVGFILKLQ